MTPEQIAAQAIHGFEGRVGWMYLDINGFVTVGDGLMLPTRESALALPFVDPNTLQALTPQPIQADYDRVHGMTKGRVALAYRAKNSPFLPDAACQELLIDTVHHIGVALLGKFPKLYSYPDTAQAAMLETAYNIGVGGFMKFTQLGHDIVGGDWVAAAKDCNVRGGEDQLRRNAWRVKMYTEAASCTP